MLNVQTYLREGKSLEDLKNDFAIEVALHPDLPLAILNYCQVFSKPRNHPVVVECRALVLDTRDWSLVARSFPRFFNHGEYLEEWNTFDFSDFSVTEKHDGSLALIFNFEGKWIWITRGSFGAGRPYQDCPFTFYELIAEGLKLAGCDDLENLPLDPTVCYVCEITSVHNKIVRRYPETKLYLLTAYRGYDEIDVNSVTRPSGLEIVRKIPSSGLSEILGYLDYLESNDPSNEGVVARDSKGLRYKFKNSKYLALHSARGNTGFTRKTILPFVMSSDDGELNTYFPEAMDLYWKVHNWVWGEFATLLATWNDCKDIPEQKFFAQAIMPRTRFSGLLFQLRKQGSHCGANELNALWQQATDTIIKFMPERFE